MARPNDTTHPNKAAFPPGIGGPALRALSSAGIRSMADLTNFSETELAALHGMGPRALGLLRDALFASGWSFRRD